MILCGIEYDNNSYDIEFTDEGNAERVWLCVGSGFKVDVIEVTDYVSDVLKEHMEAYYDNRKQIFDSDHEYETWRDNKRDGGAA